MKASSAHAALAEEADHAQQRRETDEKEWVEKMKTTRAQEPLNSGMFAEMLRQVRRVPRGKVATYGDIAHAAGYPGAARQVAWALHGQSAGLAWHRIIGAGGRILLTGEQGFEQRMNLQAEGVSFLGLKVNMAAHHYIFPAKTAKKNARKSAENAGARRTAQKSSGKGTASGRERSVR